VSRAIRTLRTLSASLVVALVLGACGGADQVRNTGYTSTPEEEWRDFEDASNDYAPWVGMLAPAASVRVPIDPADEQEPDYGLIWTVPFIVVAGDYRHSGALSVSHYLRTSLRVNRLLYRVRLATWLEQNPRLHMFLGGGGYVDNYGGGPISELAFLIGRLDNAGLLISSTWSYSPEEEMHVLQFSAGTWIPYVW